MKPRQVINMQELDIVILAAGKGTRMRSQTPKVLHTLAGKPMVQHVLDTAAGLCPARTHVVIGHGAEQLREALVNYPVQFAVQAEQKARVMRSPKRCRNWAAARCCCCTVTYR